MMRKLRRTLSFRSRSKHRASNNPANWENDSINIKHGGLSFATKYIGALEVQESRGTQVCSNAAQQLKMNQHGRKRRVTLWVTEDTLRVIDDITKSLVVDQVIEKVSFCTPDPNDEKLFSYICRDGTTRRWMCHSFRGIKDTGERISHAVGCAFTACLQKKQQQNMKNENFQRSASTRMSKLKEKGAANGVVLPQESVQQLQHINQAEYEERVKKAHQPKPVSSPTSKDADQHVNGVPSPESNKSTHTFVRPRPTPTDPSPFTRHMSLPYRSKPMGHGLGQVSNTYKALTDDSTVPHLPDFLNDESSSVHSAAVSTSKPANQGQVSQADMWLASATSEPESTNLLVTTMEQNPFSTASSTITTQGPQAWNQHGHMAASQEQKPNPFGGTASFEQTWAASVAHQSPPTTQPPKHNPFAVEFGGKHEQFV